MGNTTKDLVLVIAPELADITNNLLWDTILADVADDIVVSVFGTKQERAQRYLAAHLLTLSNPDPNRNPLASGPIISEKTGPLSVTYGRSSWIVKGDGNLDLTSYGKQFKAIRDSCVVGIKSFIPGIVSST